MITASQLRFAKPTLRLLMALSTICSIQSGLAGPTVISDQPIFVTNSVPPNMMLALSVEWPTGVVAAYKNNSITYNSSTYDTAYTDSATTRYVGYFDPTFCYKYYESNGTSVNNTPVTPLTGTRDVAAAAAEYFRPVAKGTGTTFHVCDGTAFSGNFLNWVSTHAIDGFRFTLTGGDRVVDTASKSVLEKSRHTGQGGYAQFPIKRISSNVENFTPFSWSNVYVRVTNDATELNPFNDINTRGRVIQVSNNSSFASGGGNITYNYLVRVQVCDQTHTNSALRFEYLGQYNGKDDFNLCLGYPVGSSTPTVYKPVGLIQKNSGKMRFGATGYLLDSTDARAGGVLRARMKSVGPKLVVPNGTPPVNSHAEWNEDTGILNDNPDSEDAAASGVTNSGVINYLNKFGKKTTSNLKSTDPFSELYYAALRSLRNMSAVPEYVSGVSNAMKEGFPVITTPVTEPTAPFNNTNLASLPIQYSCQQNNIVGIADTNCHTDVFVPGNTLTGYTGHPTTGLTDIDSVNATNSINVVTLGNAIGRLEFSPAKNLGTTYQGSGGRKNTFHLASLAYWANTKDMLPDNADKPWTKDKQQAKSYFVDVRENGSDGMINNQMWLAAKYGGFDDRNSDGTPATLDTWHTNRDVFNTSTTNQPGATTANATTINLSGARPDNYFTGDSPEKLFDALSSIFNSALARSLSGAGASISTINFQVSTTSNGAYTVQYNAKDWTGDIKGNQIVVDSDGTPTVTNVWSAQAKLDNQVSNSGLNNGWDTGRKIVTYRPGSGGVTFRWSSLSSTQQGYLVSEDLLKYLRGNQCHEVGNTLTAGCTDATAHKDLFRIRTHILGDIINSEATVVGAPDATYTGLSGYSAFITKYKTTTPRKRMLYVGANDGMMHAFDADVGSPATTTPVAAAVAPGATAGQELWAYVPNMALGGPTLPTAAPETDGLAARAAKTNFTHKYFIDQTPFIRDIDFSNTIDGSSLPACANPGTTGCYWRTILVGGMGKGGRGYYAIDVTNPADLTTETIVAGKVLWEFTDADMGYSFGRPVVVRTQRDGWVVILSSGYNNTFGTAANKGKGFLYILNARTGELIQKISTGAGSETNPSGFAHPAAFIPDSTQYLTDYVYGGDLQGNLWRFDLRGTPTEYPSPVKLAKLTTDGSDGSADATVIQPVTVQPKIEIGANGVDRWVFIGTGQLLTLTDMDVTQQQTFYAFRDGSLSQVYGTETGQSTLPSSVTFPVLRDKLVANTNLLTGRVSDATKPMGWFYDMHNLEKITTPLVANEGLISWNGYLPTTDACAPGAASNLYVTDYDTGKSRLTSNGEAVEFYMSATYLVKLQFVKDSAGKIRAILSTGDPVSGNQIKKGEGQFGRTAGTAVRVNWREIMN